MSGKKVLLGGDRHHCGSKDLYHVYIGKEHYCHSAVVARISMYGERLRYFIEIELRQQ